MAFIKNRKRTLDDMDFEASQTVPSPAQKQEKVMTPAPASMIPNTAGRMRMAKFRPWILQCGKYRWQVNMDRLAARSRFFDAVANAKFREAEERVVVLPEDEPNDIARMLHWCSNKNFPLGFWDYTIECCSVPEKSNLKRSMPEEMINIFISMYCLADKYIMPDLQDQMIEKMIEYSMFGESSFMIAFRRVHSLKPSLRPTLLHALASIYWTVAKKLSMTVKEELYLAEPDFAWMVLDTEWGKFRV